MEWRSLRVNDKHLHNIQVGDLVKIHSKVSGRLAIVLAIHPSRWCPSPGPLMQEVDVLLGDKQQHFVMYELEKI